MNAANFSFLIDGGEIDLSNYHYVRVQTNIGNNQDDLVVTFYLERQFLKTIINEFDADEKNRLEKVKMVEDGNRRE